MLSTDSCRSPRRLLVTLMIQALAAASPALADLESLAVAETADQLLELIATLSLEEADLDARAGICFADRVPPREANRRLIVAGWPGPYFAGAGVGTPKLISAPAVVLPRDLRADLAAGAPPILFRFVVDAAGRSRSAYGTETTVPGLFEGASDALHTFRYEPAKVNGSPGAVCHAH